MRLEENWEAKFANITYRDALEIAKDSNIKEISIMHNIGTSEESISEYMHLDVNLTAFDKNAIKNYHIVLTEGRFPENKSEIVVDKSFLEKNIGEQIELTINGIKNNYIIVGKTENMLPNGVGGSLTHATAGCIAYYDETAFNEYTIVDITILTKNIKKIFKTTKDIASRLNLYETSEEQYENLTYFNALLNYALVDMEDTRVRTSNSIEEIGEDVPIWTVDADSLEFGEDLRKVVIGIIAITRNICYYCNIYFI